jgi:universal stress protein A
MLPFKKILCPTDFSEPACRGIVAAAELAESFGAELILMHTVVPIPVVDTPAGVAGFDIVAYQDELVRGAQQSLDERMARRVPETVKARTMVTIGDPAHEVVRIAEEEGADLIVVATHGTTGWRHRLFGSVAEKIVRMAKCPVVTVYCGEGSD